MEQAAARKTPPNLYIWKLSFAHFAAGMLMLLAAMLAAVWLVPDIARQGTFRTTEGWLLAHMLLLGFASLTAIGASYQLVQVILRTSLYSRVLGWVQLVCYVSGLLLILTGFGADARLIAPGGSLTVAGIALYAVNIGMTLLRKKEWSPLVFGMILSTAAFLSTGLFGTLLGLHLGGYLNAPAYAFLFGGHIWLGVGGWLSGLIVVFSFKLLPMFYVSPKKATRAVYGIIGGFHLGIWLQVLSLCSGLGGFAAAAYICLAASAVAFAVYAFGIRRSSRAKQPIGAVRVGFYLIPVQTALFLIWGAAQRLDLDIAGASFRESQIVWLVAGWFVPSILGYLSKILPFLWWAHRFRTKEQKKGAILLSDMLPERRLSAELVGYLCGAAVMVAGFCWNAAAMATIGQLAMVGFMLVYLFELSRVFKH